MKLMIDIDEDYYNDILKLKDVTNYETYLIKEGKPVCNTKYEIDKESLARSIQHDGSFIKHVVCMEELAELQQAVSKSIRGEEDRNNLIEEIADVLICIENIKILHFISDSKINEQISYKIDRQKQRESEEK